MPVTLPPGLFKLLTKPSLTGVGAHVEYDGDRRSRTLCGGQRSSTAHGNNDGNLPFDQVVAERGKRSG